MLRIMNVMIMLMIMMIIGCEVLLIHSMLNDHTLYDLEASRWLLAGDFLHADHPNIATILRIEVTLRIFSASLEKRKKKEEKKKLKKREKGRKDTIGTW